MAGDEEVRARAVLTEMQMRILQGPESALGLGDSLSVELVRSTFLQLTKQFHPARFGRMSPDVQRMSNEVFLGIKSAHDQLQRILGGTVRGGRSGQSGSMQVQTDFNTERTFLGHQPPGQPQQFARGTDRSPHRTSSSMPATEPSARASTPAIGVPHRSGMATPANGVPTQQALQRPTGAHAALPRPGTPAPAAPQSPNSHARPGTPPPATQQGARQPWPAPAQVQTRPGSPPPTTTPSQRPTGAYSPQSRPPAPAAQRPSTQQRAAVTPGPLPPRPQTDELNPATVRGIGATSTTQAPPVGGARPVADERTATRQASMLINEQSWDAARQVLEGLVAKVPQSRSYRALLHYVTGRAAQQAGRNDVARSELERALQLDPALDQARQAIAGLR